MPAFCDVAVPVPLEGLFTYRVPEGMQPVAGGRVLVPFRQQRLSGIVIRTHDNTPPLELKNILAVIDAEPSLDEALLRLGQWIADYYLAPIGEVLRSMLPLSAEFKRTITYEITDQGRTALHAAATKGAVPRGKQSAEDQMTEFHVLEFLNDREAVRESSLRSATQATRKMLAAMVRKGTLQRQDVSGTQAAERVVHVAVLKDVESGKLNANQARIVEALQVAGGRMPVAELRSIGVPSTTLKTLVRRGTVEICDEAAEFHMSSVRARPATLTINFTAEQQDALRQIEEAVEAKQFRGFLMHGVTGSGKTAVYLAAMRAVLDAGRSAILLVPEIGLTPAVAADLHQTFGDEVAILHSGLSDRERAEQWRRIKRQEARMVVGTRSAIFAPVTDLALVIVDEEHDSSYKQEETPRYHARDVAVMRAKMTDAVVVLGSATPSLESYYNAKRNRYTLLDLPNRVEQRPMPEIEIVDMRDEFQQTGKEQPLSRTLAGEIGERLQRHEQIMVLLNRRGYSPIALCRSCGRRMECRNCAVAMTHHKNARKMVCHYCGFEAPVPKVCAECGSEYVYFLGTGSEKLEEVLHGMFPQARIGRLDRDTVHSRQDFERVLNALDEGDLDLLVGTQMIAKGHDIHGVTLVGVVAADAALGMPDFRAAERTFQLLTQVAGRAGRGETPGKVVLQTYFPDHYAVVYAAQHDFHSFYDKELRFRSWMHYPPYSALANVLVHSEDLNQALSWAGILGKWFEEARHPGVRVLGPAAAPIVRLKRDYRYHFVLK
nr:primosomal protein N' [Terriglobales bacterium]